MVDKFHESISFTDKDIKRENSKTIPQNTERDNKKVLILLTEYLRKMNLDLSLSTDQKAGGSVPRNYTIFITLLVEGPTFINFFDIIKDSDFHEQTLST